MSSRASSAAIASEPRYRNVFVWQWGVRLFHWAVAASITVLLATGLFIADPFLRSSGEPWNTFLMANVRLAHNLAGFVFLVAVAWRIFWFVFGNSYARSGFPRFWSPSWWRELVHQAFDYLRYDFSHVHLGHNALAGLSYVLFVGVLGLAQILTGFALYSQTNPGGFWDRATGWVIPLLGGGMRTHAWHNLFAWGFLVFVILHLYIALLDARQYKNGLIRAMFTGYKRERLLPEKEREDES